VLRNQTLGNDLQTTDTFQFSTPEVMFVDPIMPLLDYKKYELGLAEEDQKQLKDYLQSFFNSLLYSAKEKEILVRLVCNYSYNIVSSFDALITYLPIKLLLPTPTTPKPHKVYPFIEALANSVTDWINVNKPINDENSKINFDLTVFGGTTLQMPLLTIRDLFLHTKKLRR